MNCIRMYHVSLESIYYTSMSPLCLVLAGGTRIVDIRTYIYSSCSLYDVETR